MECIVKVNPIEFANGLHVEYKWGIKDDFKILPEQLEKWNYYLLHWGKLLEE